jgi:hypothetical protein
MVRPNIDNHPIELGFDECHCPSGTPTAIAIYTYSKHLDFTVSKQNIARHAIACPNK